MSFQRRLIGSISGTALLSVLFVQSASASVLWRGDFSTGNIKQWSGAEVVSSDRLQVVDDPLGGTAKALKATVHQGDDPINSSGNRNEVLYTGDDVGDGQADRYYHWRTMWPVDYASADTWQLFTQWHQYDGGGSPPVEFFVNGENVNLTVLRNGDHPIWSVPLQRGVWHDFVAHVRWSTSASTGFVELWYDGMLALPRTPAVTMFGSDGVYLKQGLYRSETISATQSVYHSDMTIGTTLDDVWPAAPPPAPPPAGTADAGTTTTPPVATPPSSETPVTGEASTQTGTVAKLQEKAGCSQPGLVGFAGVMPLVFGLLRRRSYRRGGGASN